MNPDNPNFTPIPPRFPDMLMDFPDSMRGLGFEISFMASGVGIVIDNSLPGDGRTRTLKISLGRENYGEWNVENRDVDGNAVLTLAELAMARAALGLSPRNVPRGRDVICRMHETTARQLADDIRSATRFVPDPNAPSPEPEPQPEDSLMDAIRRNEENRLANNARDRILREGQRPSFRIPLSPEREYSISYRDAPSQIVSPVDHEPAQPETKDIHTCNLSNGEVLTAYVDGVDEGMQIETHREGAGEDISFSLTLMLPSNQMVFVKAGTSTDNAAEKLDKMLTIAAKSLNKYFKEEITRLRAELKMEAESRQSPISAQAVTSLAALREASVLLQSQ